MLSSFEGAERLLSLTEKYFLGPSSSRLAQLIVWRFGTCNWLCMLDSPSGLCASLIERRLGSALFIDPQPQPACIKYVNCVLPVT